MTDLFPAPATNPRAQPRSSDPLVSVIIPVYAAGNESVAWLRNALLHLKASLFQDFEVLVADDASPAADRVGAVVLEMGARLVRLDRRSGPAAARNRAARKAAGSILVFLDADTTVHPDTLDRFVRKFSETEELDAIMGSYDREPTAPGTVSRFRNLLHSFVHHRAVGRVETFWAGCGAVRRERFDALGGFDETYSRPSIEDVEFGLRLTAAGGSIELDPRIQVTHHKLWTLRSMVQTDLVSRAIPWAGIIRRHSGSLDLTFKIWDRLSAAIAAITILSAIVALIHGGAWWLAPLISLAAIGLLNHRLIFFLFRTMGWKQALLCFPLLFAYLITCVTGLIGGIALAEHRRDRWLWPVVASVGFVLLAVQFWGGAFQAEFTGHQDEAAHFVSGVMVYDYLATLPPANPVDWAGQYYLHYPKVAIGQWPPLYHAMEGLWWLFLKPSRTTAMLLQWAIGLAALTMLYRLSREFLPLIIAIAIVAFTIAAPVFQESLQLAMADLTCLLWAVLGMHAAVRLLQKRDRMAAFLVVLWLAAAALTKGTAVCLVPVPLLALVASGQKIRVPLRWLLLVGGGLIAALGLYALMWDIRAWGGISFDVPFTGDIIGYLAGWGFLGLACLGVRRNPLALVAASVIVSTFSVAFVVRAMQEYRHWMIALPAILLLAGFAIERFRRPWVRVLLLAPAVALFHYAHYSQAKSGYTDLLSQLARPARMLVSSADMGEGPWIAVASLAERRPSSFITRATKVLAEEGWNGEGYHLIATTGEAVLRRLDELAVNTVVLHTPPGPAPPAHHVLLRDTVTVSPSWSRCGQARHLLAYCRVTAPQVRRLPLRLSVHGWNFEERIAP